MDPSVAMNLRYLSSRTHQHRRREHLWEVDAALKRAHHQHAVHDRAD